MTIDSLLAGDVAAFRDAVAHLILPSMVLGWAVAGTISRLVRANMLDVIGREFILTARAKGAGELRVVFRHALRNIHGAGSDSRQLFLCLSHHRGRAD